MLLQPTERELKLLFEPALKRPIDRSIAATGLLAYIIILNTATTYPCIDKR